MSKAKKLVREYLVNLPAGRCPPVARRTEFTRQANGVVVRREIEAGLADSEANQTTPVDDVAKELGPSS